MSNGKKQGVVWIAGVGASAGLGGALARRFGGGGLSVALTGRTAARLEALAAQLREAGIEAHVLAGDVADEAWLGSAVERVRELGPLRAAIFNAASMLRTPTLEISAQQFEEVWRVTTLGGFLFGREATRALLSNDQAQDAATGRGTLLFTGASASLRGRPLFAAFGAAKAGLRSVAQSYAREFGPQGIHVAHVIVDGGINGERLRSNAPQRVEAAGADGLLDIEAIAETYWQLHLQHRSAWTHELDLRPYKESF